MSPAELLFTSSGETRDTETSTSVLTGGNRNSLVPLSSTVSQSLNFWESGVEERKEEFREGVLEFVCLFLIKKVTP